MVIINETDFVSVKNYYAKNVFKFCKLFPPKNLEFTTSELRLNLYNFNFRIIPFVAADAVVNQESSSGDNNSGFTPKPFGNPPFSGSVNLFFVF